MCICSAGLKNKEVVISKRNMIESVLVDQQTVVTAEESRLLFSSFKDSKSKI